MKIRSLLGVSRKTPDCSQLIGRSAEEADKLLKARGAVTFFVKGVRYAAESEGPYAARLKECLDRRTKELGEALAAAACINEISDGSDRYREWLRGAMARAAAALAPKTRKRDLLKMLLSKGKVIMLEDCWRKVTGTSQGSS